MAESQPSGQEAERREGLDWLTTGGKVLALLAILLPVAGWIVRWVSFAANGTTGGLADQLASGAPIAQLALTGVGTIVPAAGIVPFMALYIWIPRPKDQPPLTKTQRRITLGCLTVPIAALVLLAPWPLDILYVPSPLISIVAMVWATRGTNQRERRDQRSSARSLIRHGWWVSAPAMLLAAVSLGLLTSSPDILVATYSFTGGTGIHDGRYIQLGADSTKVYLQKCKPNSGDSIFAVNASAIASQSNLDALQQNFLAAPNLVYVLRTYVIPAMETIGPSGGAPGETLGYQPPTSC
jgi:hypothetical protein